MPSYFESHYDDISYAWGSALKAGMRKAQIAAMHSIAAHFATRSDNALITMPTGSGKSAVMATVPFLLGAKRCLVVASSKVVRHQLCDDISKLRVLKHLGVLPAGTPNPRTFEVVNQRNNAGDWTELEQYDFVFATPQVISPGYAAITAPPADLFDVVIFDEAHHVAAATWEALRVAFPEARICLFTATPFRRDRQEVPGRLVYSYSIAEALRDGIYSKIDFCPVDPADPSDHAIALSAVERLREDQDAGFNHRLIVRTNTVERAKELFEIYEALLPIGAVASYQSRAQIDRTLEQLRTGELDGVICVDMLAEGFDFPELKVAALHKPHKSLETTLQFVGRLTRTAGDHIGTASVHALAVEIQDDSTTLFAEGAAWSELIPGLAGERVGEEVDLKETIEDLSATRKTLPTTEGASFYSFRPSMHAQVVRCDDGADMDAYVTWPRRYTCVDTATSVDRSCRIDVLKTVSRERWCTTDAYVSESFTLVFTYFDADTSLLFVNSSDRSAETYEAIAVSIGKGETVRLTMSEIDGALGDLDQARCFGVGLKPTNPHAAHTSYKNLTGSNADDAVTISDASDSVLGHVFASGKVGGANVTKGCSASSRVWSSTRGFINQYVKWCKAQATLIAAGADITTHSNFDRVGRSTRATDFGTLIPLSMEWGGHAVWTGDYVLVNTSTGESVNLLNCEFVIDRPTVTVTGFEYDLVGSDLRCRCTFAMGSDSPHAIVPGQDNFEIHSSADAEEHFLVTYLNESLPVVRLSDGSTTNGWASELCGYETGGTITEEDCVVIDWAVEGVDIRSELNPPAGFSSVQEWCLAEAALACDVVIHDHTTGESADVVGIRRLGNTFEIELWHCKGSKTAVAGTDLSNLYDLAGQAMKNLGFCSPALLTRHLRRRYNEGIAKIIVGTQNDFTQALADIPKSECHFLVRIVQPGFAISKISDEAGQLLAFCADSCQRGSRDFKVVCSK